MHTESISVVVPCYNEEKTIFRNLKIINDYLKTRFKEYEIVVVNDGSRDETVQEIKKAEKEISLRLINNPVNSGKGKAIKDGILSCDSEILIFLDADLGIPIYELEKFVSEIKNGYDLVIASRFVPGFKIKLPVLWYRKHMEKIFRLLRLLVLNMGEIKDTQCGFKVFKKEIAQKIFPKVTIKRFAFDAEVIHIAREFNCKIKELPIALQNPSDSHVNLIRDPVNMSLDLIRIKINSMRGKYK